MGGVSGQLLQLPVTDWLCVGCGHTDRTREPRTHTRMHACPGAGGMTVPMIVDDGRRTRPGGRLGELVLHDREDYVRDEDVQRADDGRVLMASRVVTDTTEHLFVYAPTAYADGDAANGGTR